MAQLTKGLSAIPGGQIPPSIPPSKGALSKQEGGDHYSKLKIQPIEYIQANGLDFFQGNILKYLTRHKDKDGAKDLRKVIHYAQLALELQYGEMHKEDAK